MAITDISAQDFQDLQELIEQAVAKAEEIAHAAGGSIQSQMDAYTIPGLQSWSADSADIPLGARYQPGSVGSLFAQFEEEWDEGEDIFRAAAARFQNG